ncbi:response regulator [Edaphobacter albus]|uniref:response regulator n=1 Tax=Edaphobacter sp. 4G125 TaxID=2763071 RepID=UPI001648727B|nr:response regulator transcription factor [Edaphobacter sp. 4G125]QNI38004.1 response regulator transcription factor [Edaphobacter sp. 4G125]
MSELLRILLIDDHTLFRESLVRLLEAEPGFQVVAHCATATEAAELIKGTVVDIVLLDYDLGEEVGTTLLEKIRMHKDKPKILMVTAGMRDSLIRNALSAGVSGIIFKHSGPGQLIEGIHKIARGEMWLDTGAIRSLIAVDEVPASSHTPSLTARQYQVLRGILDGLTNKEIASILGVSETSVKAVIQELFHKAGARTRSQLVRIAIEEHSTTWLAEDH